MGATADWVFRWNAPGMGYKHQGYVKMYILFFSNHLRCKTDGDHSSGRLEMRLFELLDNHGEREAGRFLNKGKGNEGLAEDSNRCGINYLVVYDEEDDIDGKKKTRPDAGSFNNCPAARTKGFEQLSSQELALLIE